MQTALTYLFNTVLLTGVTYLGIGFILGLIDRWKRTAPAATTKVAKVKTAQVPLSLPAAQPVPLNLQPMPARETVPLQAEWEDAMLD